eukprot:gene7918-8114_t
MLDITQLMPAALWSEGPTAGALQEMLDNIDKQTEQIRAVLFQTLTSQLANAAQQYDGVDPKVLSAMASLASLPSSSDTEQWVASCANQYKDLQQYITALQTELKAATAAADLEKTLKEFKDYIENGQFSDAAYDLVRLRKVLDDSTSHTPGRKGAALVGAELVQLQAACATCEQELLEALTASLSEVFDTSGAAGGVITISCSLPSGGDVGEMWSAMDVAGLAEQQLQKVADIFLQLVLPYVLPGSARLSSHILPSGDSAQIRWSAGTEAPGGTDVVEQECMQLLSVLAEALFRQRAATLAAFGKLFWRPFVDQYQAAFLQQVSGSNVAVLQARQEAALQMEKQAVSMGLAEPGSDLSSCLSRAIQESYHIVQEQYLAQARDLFLSHDPHAPPVTVGQPLPLDAAFYQRYQQGHVKAWEVLDPPSGWDINGPLLATGHYPVCHTVLQLVMMVDDALAYACHQGDTSMAQAIVAAVSKMARLYPRMLPAPAAADAPALALQHHNDLQYLANHMLVVPFLFGQELQELLGVQLWFGDDSLKLRADARAAFHDTLAVQNAAIKESLVPLLQLSASFAAGKSRSAKEVDSTATAARQAVLYTLARAGRLLWSSLAPAAALEASQQLLEPLASMLVADVLGKQDIGEAEAAGLVRMYRPVLEGALPELLGDVDLSSQAVPAADVDLKELVSVALQHRCHNLRKLDAVLGLLEARLADIVSAWEIGALQAAGLSLPDVGQLVVALFEDTDYRAQCLQRMEAAEDM